ncbi:hypothetical protein ANSO36C_66650 (plasmid) [Nostoc cf. commune SO-36]|jgi:hypothetical protein|nr:plasmid mobilization relaxosome protein MobC [Nostoc commune]BDI20863.1 hypothetical protein ANSO36C_66650 [Nostoc cf. commune SO-36]
MRQKRSHRIDIRLTLAEYEKAQLMADENNLTMSELFRAKTLKNRLPRRVTKVAGQTYWELGKIGNNLNQIAKAINTSVLMGEPVVVDRALLSQVRDLVKQVRREIAEIDLITDLQDEA